jgi:hypothetical protein
MKRQATIAEQRRFFARLARPAKLRTHTRPLGAPRAARGRERRSACNTPTRGSRRAVSRSSGGGSDPDEPEPALGRAGAAHAAGVMTRG